MLSRRAFLRGAGIATTAIAAPAIVGLAVGAPALAKRRSILARCRGVDPAALNFGDCFAYEVAKENACPLPYVGGDFAKTDIPGVL